MDIINTIHISVHVLLKGTRNALYDTPVLAASKIWDKKLKDGSSLNVMTQGSRSDWPSRNLNSIFNDRKGTPAK